MLDAVPDLDVLVMPIGGGGLIAGIATAAKAIKPDIEVIGVEAELYPSMKQTLAGEPVSCAGATIAEGIAVKSPGHHHPGDHPRSWWTISSWSARNAWSARSTP